MRVKPNSRSEGVRQLSSSALGRAGGVAWYSLKIIDINAFKDIVTTYLWEKNHNTGSVSKLI